MVEGREFQTVELQHEMSENWNKDDCKAARDVQVGGWGW